MWVVYVTTAAGRVRLPGTYRCKRTAEYVAAQQLKIGANVLAAEAVKW